MAIYSTLANRAAASRPYSNPDLDSSKGEGSSTCNAAPWLNTIKGRISGAPGQYTKVWYLGLNKRLGWVLFFYVKVISSIYLAYIQDIT